MFHLIYTILFSLQLIWSNDTSVEGKVSLDDFGNVYIYNDSELVKYDKNGASFFVFSSLRNGEITEVDVTNPLRIAVYYQENNEVLFLDNTLSEQNQGLSFNELLLYDVTKVCSSFQNHLWAYRSAEQKLVRMNRAGQIINESLNLAQWIRKAEVQGIKESGNFLYVVLDDGKILVFDQYGSYVKAIPLPIETQVHFIDSRVLYIEKNDIYIMDVTRIPEPELVYSFDEQFSKTPMKIDFTLNKLALIKDGKIELHALKP